MDSNAEDLSSIIKELDKKMNSFSSILEKFGLDIITKMGQTNQKITHLTDNVEELDKAIIDIKGLMPQLSNIIQNQKHLEDELSLIKSLIVNIKSFLSVADSSLSIAFFTSCFFNGVELILTINDLIKFSSSSKCFWFWVILFN